MNESSSSPEGELVRAELADARRKRRTGRAPIVGTLVSVAIIAAVFAFALPGIADYVGLPILAVAGLGAAGPEATGWRSPRSSASPSSR